MIYLEDYLMPKIGLNEVEKVAGAALYLLGDGALDMIYHVVNPSSKATPDAFHRQALRWRRGEQMQTYLEELASIHRDPFKQSEETQDETPITKSYLVRELRNSLSGVSDPESRSKIIMRIADLTNLKKADDEETKKDPRIYFLPWVSSCRHCRLMEIYQDEQKRREGCVND